MLLLCIAAFAVVAKQQERGVYGELLPRDRKVKMGGEYNEIAIAVRQGRGFSDPFGRDTGPTAWQAPVLPYILATVYWLVDDSPEDAQNFIFALHLLAVFFTGSVILSEARRMRLQSIGMVIFVIYLVCNFHAIFQETADAWIMLIAVNLLYLSTLRILARQQRVRESVRWGALGGICTLCNPVLGFLWGGLSISIAKWRRIRGSWLVLSLCMMVSMVAPWVIRTRVAVGIWAPVKSNAPYEFWQANVLDRDGVIGGHVFTWHPYSGKGENSDLYSRQGESGFIQHFRDESISYVLNHPIAFLRKVGARFCAACVSYFLDDSWSAGKILDLINRVIFPLPFIAVCMLICFAKRRRKRILILVQIYSLWLFPYIVISYYPRYGTGILLIKMLLVLYLVKLLIECGKQFRGWAGRATSQGDLRTSMVRGADV